MIGTWMLYSILVTSLCVVAAHFAEAAWLLKRREVRVVWVIALSVSVALMFLGVRRPHGQAGPIRSPIVNSLDYRRSRASVSSENVLISEGARRSTVDRNVIPRVVAALKPFDKTLLGAWIAGSAVWMLFFVVGAVRARQVFDKTQHSVIDGVNVRVSRDWGPAVAGVLRYSIVVPEWVERLAPTERGFVLLHETEHARVRDPVLIAIAAFFIFLLPWNVALWYIHSRLRGAVEIDCDSRVLRKLPDVTTYAELLVNVGERTMVTRASWAAFAESASILHKRIRLMAVAGPPRVRTLATLNTIAASTVLFAACAVPLPYAPFRAPAADTPVRSLEASGGRAAAERSGRGGQVKNSSQHRSFAVTSPALKVPPVSSIRVAKGGELGDSSVKGSVPVPLARDSLASIAKRLEPSAFDSTRMPYSVVVGLAFDRSGALVSHRSTKLVSDDEVDVADEAEAGPNAAIGGTVMQRLFPGVNVRQDVKSLTIERIVGKRRMRQVFVLAVQLVR